MSPQSAATAQYQMAGLSGVQAASGQSTGNPLLDAYAGQYAALAAAQGMYGSQAAALVGQHSMNGLDASQAGVTSQAAAGYLQAAGYYTMPTTAAQLQQSAALYAAQPSVSQQSATAAAGADGRLQ